MSHGSFGKVTAASRSSDGPLTEEVNQVRKFRNRGARGRRDAPEYNVNPERAFDRLQRDLERLTAAGATGIASGTSEGQPSQGSRRGRQSSSMTGVVSSIRGTGSSGSDLR